MRVTVHQAPYKVRTLTALTGLSLDVPLQINNGDIRTLECALKERLFYHDVNGQWLEPFQATPVVINKILGDFKQQLLELMPSTTPFTVSEVISTYRGRKHTIYMQAAETLNELGLKRSDATSVSFVKVEKVPDKAPRCINPRKPVYNLVLGKYIKPAEHKIYRVIKKMFGDGPTVMKGYNVKEVGAIIRGKWRSFADPVAIGLDASRFDQHVCWAMLEWEHSIYNAIFHGNAELKELLSWQLYNKGVGFCDDGKLNFKVKGRRFSGDMNTALGNCLIMCACVWTYARHKGIDVKLVDNGDDATVFMERDCAEPFIDGLMEWFADLGFIMKIEKPVYKLCQVEFCQMHPIEVGEDCIMVRNIVTSMRKDTLSVLGLNTKQEVQCLLSAIGVGGLHLTGGVPIVQNFYRKLLQLGEGYTSKVGDNHIMQTGMTMLSVGMCRNFHVPLAETRVQVMEAWGYTPDEQICLEQLIDAYQLDNFEFTAVDNLNTTIFLPF